MKLELQNLYFGKRESIDLKDVNLGSNYPVGREILKGGFEDVYFTGQDRSSVRMDISKITGLVIVKFPFLSSGDVVIDDKEKTVFLRRGSVALTSVGVLDNELKVRLKWF